MNFPEILKEIMLEKNLSQVDLAQMAGIKQSQVSEWLKGKAKPGYDTLRTLSKTLEISSDVLLGLTELISL